VLDSINVVTLRWARLVPRWMTVLGQVNQPGTKPGTQVDSGKNSESCITVGPVIRTAGILVYSQ